MDRRERVDCGRRRLLQGLAGGGLLGLAGGVEAAGLMATPAQDRGPFYPRQPSLGRDNDLVQVDGRDGLADGEITDLQGRVLDRDRRPIRDVLVEIWQCDANGRYLHRRDRGGPPRDPSFQGYGRLRTGADGRYRFRTIRPVPYPGRAPHIHFAVQAPERAVFTTQMYVEGAPQNARDWLLNAVDDAAARQALIVPFTPAAAGLDARLQARFDLVLS